MTLPQLLLLTTLTWTNPTTDMADSCGVVAWPNDDLDHVEVWGAPRWEPVRLLALVPVAGRQGLRDSVSVDVGAEGAGWVVAVDDVGNASCPAPFDAYGKTTDVPPETFNPEHVHWYDVAGRRIEKPVRSGVYFIRIDTGVKKVRVIR